MKSIAKLSDYKHQPGGSCIASALNGIFRYNGFKYSQEFIIGAGLNFGFISDPRRNIWNVEFISSKMLYQILLSNTGVFGEEIQIEDNDKALQKLLLSINDGIPVAVKLDPMHCEGLLRTTSQELLPYLPAHNVVVFGYDLDNRKVFLYDSPGFNPLEMDMDRFCEARNSGSTYPMNTYYELFFAEKAFPIEISMKLAIQGVIERYKYTGKYLNFRTGFTALDRFGGNVKNWKNDFSDDEIAEKARSLKMSLTNGQAIKGAFRNHFALFLLEAKKFLPFQLDEAIDQYKDLARLWIQIENTLDNIIADPDKEKYFTHDSLFISLIDDVIKREINAVNLLESIIN